MRNVEVEMSATRGAAFVLRVGEVRAIAASGNTAVIVHRGGPVAYITRDVDTYRIDPASLLPPPAWLTRAVTILENGTSA